MLKAGGIGAAAGFVIALGLGFLLLAVGAGMGNPLPLPVSGPARAAPFWPTDPQPIRPSDSITPYLYLPLVMRAYRPPPPPPVYPNDPYYYTYGYQWGLNKVRAPEAWALSTGQGVLIAVLDTGTDYIHPDLSGKVRTDIDWDFVNNDDNARDDHGHGTHVSGIAAAATNNSIGVAGMGWDASILPLKVMDSQGRGSTAELIPAIYYAADHGARVINMSLAGTTRDNLCPSDVQAAVDYAYRRGVLLVAAAGNWPYIAQSPFPANCAHVLGVAATTSSDSRAWFSNYGDHVSVAAPGEDIYSTLRYGGYGDMDGTPCATLFYCDQASEIQRWPPVLEVQPHTYCVGQNLAKPFGQ